uniref:Putative LOV domain-containing protein n=1 Tax=Sargassum thunbergii TaxID=127542 RepID=A0A126X4B0_9PHAE|nr:putative LOV domain-containing protein [Sargassum thunbergii]
MGNGASSCKGLMNPQQQEIMLKSRKAHGSLDADGVPQPLSTATNDPLLPSFEDREPFKPRQALSAGDASLLKALTHHRTPFAVVDVETSDLRIIYASGGWVAGMRTPVEQIEETAFSTVLKKGIKAAQEDIELLETAIREKEDLPLVVKGVTARNKSVPYTQFFTTPATAAGEPSRVVYAFVSLQPVSGPEVEPSQTMPYRFRRAWECLEPSAVWSLFTPYKTLCEADAGLVRALQDRREMFCITDPELYDNPIVFVSDDFVDMTGYDREEINGINCRFLQGEMTSPEDVEVIRYGIREQTDMRVCLLNYRKNGTAFLNQFNLSPLRDVTGKLAFFIGVQIEVEDAEVLPFPTTRQTLQELLIDEEEKDFWEDAELAPAQESAVVAYEREKAEAEELAKVGASYEMENDALRGEDYDEIMKQKAEEEIKVSEGAVKSEDEKVGKDTDPMEG